MIPLKKTPRLNGMKSSKKNLEKIIIPCCKTHEILKIDEIVRFEALQNYCRAILTNGSTLTSTNTLGYYKELLHNNGFISCHRSHLVNVDHIHKYHKEGSVELSDNSTVPVSRRMKENFLNSLFDNYLC